MTKFDTLYENLISEINVPMNENIFDTFKSLFKRSKKDVTQHSTEEFQKIPKNSKIVSEEKFKNYGVHSAFFKNQTDAFIRNINRYNHYVDLIKSVKVGTLKQGCTLMEKNENLYWYNKSKKKYSAPNTFPCMLTKSGILIFCTDNKIEMIMTNDKLISIDDTISIEYDMKNNTLSYSELKVKLKSSISKIPPEIKIDDLVTFSPGLNENNNSIPAYISEFEIIYMNEKSQIHSTKHPAHFIKDKQPLYYLEGTKYKNAHEWVVELDNRSKKSSK